MTKNKIISFIIIIIYVYILFNSKLISQSVISAMKAFIFNVFPNLLPTMFLGLLLVKLDISILIPKFIKKLFNKIFNFDDIKTTIFIASMICGMPSNALFINEYLNEEDKKYMLKCTKFMNPLFVISTIGLYIFKSIKIGFILLSLTYIYNFIVAFIYRSKFSQYKHNKSINDSFIKVFNKTLKTVSNTCLNILIIVIIFNILISIILSINNNIITQIISGFLELTNAILLLKKIDINLSIKFILAYIYLIHSGLSIKMQIKSII